MCLEKQKIKQLFIVQNHSEQKGRVFVTLGHIYNRENNLTLKKTNLKDPEEEKEN